jgi:response regulator RpfG family c-di-GMP phosphodiesterase
MSDAATILCVDDEPNVLSALRRELRRTPHNVDICGSGEEALAKLRERGAAVVISDLRMPGMDGVELLSRVAREHPDVVRVLLSGNGDFGASVRAINQGRVFAFVEKPWEHNELITLVDAAIAHRNAERNDAHLARALQRENDGDESATVSAVTPLLQHLGLLMEGHKAGHSERVANLVRDFCLHLGLRPRSVQDIYAAALFHDIAELELPETARGMPESRLQGADLTRFKDHVERGARILEGVEALQGAARLVRLHHERHDGRGFPRGLRGEDIPVPARVLAVADAYDEALHGHLFPRPLPEAQAVDFLMRERGRRFDPRVVTAFARWLKQQRGDDREDDYGVDVRNLKAGMRLTRDLKTPDGILLVPAGHRLTDGLIQRILSLSEGDHDRMRAHVDAAGSH